MDTTIQSILERALAGERLDFDDGLTLFKSTDLISIGSAADVIRQRKHPDKVTLRMLLIATSTTQTGAMWIAIFAPFIGIRVTLMPMSWNGRNWGRRFKRLSTSGGVLILMQGGLHPKLKLDWYEDLLRWIKENYEIHIHGFSPPELDWFAKINRISLEETLTRLRDAGLDSIPGGGAEILTDHARDEISPKKCTADEWLEVMRQGHYVGLQSSATMMYGHVESYGERVEHLHSPPRITR